MDKHKFLVVVDMQNDFVSGSLGSKEAQDVADIIMKKLESFEQKENIYFTRDSHNKDTYLNSHEGIKLPIEHCIEGAEGCELIDPIKEFIWNNNLEDHIFNKQYFASPSLPYAIYEEIYDIISIYRNSDSLDELLNNIEIEFIGLCTDICVISNIFAVKHMLERDDFDSIRLICNSKYCAGSTPERHEAALEVMRACLIDVI